MVFVDHVFTSGVSSPFAGASLLNLPLCVNPGVIITEPGAVSWDADLLDASSRGLENLGLG